MHAATRPFTILPFREVDESATRVSRTRFQIRTCERCGSLTTLVSFCVECVARQSRTE